MRWSVAGLEGRGLPHGRKGCVLAIRIRARPRTVVPPPSPQAMAADLLLEDSTGPPPAAPRTAFVGTSAADASTTGSRARQLASQRSTDRSCGPAQRGRALIRARRAASAQAGERRRTSIRQDSVPARAALSQSCPVTGSTRVQTPRRSSRATHRYGSSCSGPATRRPPERRPAAERAEPRLLGGVLAAQPSPGAEASGTASFSSKSRRAAEARAVEPSVTKLHLPHSPPRSAPGPDMK